MGLNHTARGIVLVPSLVLGGAFLATAAWVDGPAAANRSLALLIGGVLMASGGLVQLLARFRATVTIRKFRMNYPMDYKK